jgi:uncharacterized protein (TIGR02302 family)
MSRLGDRRRRRLWFGVSREQIALSWLVTAWERLWVALWPASGLAGLFLALALFDVLPRLPGWAHAIVLIGFAIASWWALRFGFSGFLLPRRHDALRRLERDLGQPHRPLSALEDHMAAGTGDKQSEALWRAHLQRMAQAADGLRIPIPTPGLPARDPRAIRALVVLLLLLALPGGWRGAIERIERALDPDFSGAGRVAAIADVWISPPDYTGLAPIYLKPNAGDSEIVVPSGSTLLARVHGGRGTPRLLVDGDSTRFVRVDTADHELRTTLTEGKRLTIRQRGHDLASWAVSVVADRAPDVAFLEFPGATHQQALRVDYEARDDYGLVKLEMTIRLARFGPDHQDDAPGAGTDSLVLPLTISGTGASERGTAYFDLTPHPWAGLPVIGQIAATDALEQTGQSAVLVFTLPERRFTNPLARSIIEHRRRLTLAPEERGQIAHSFDALIARAAQTGRDKVLILGLSSARGRLLYDREPNAISDLQTMLWELALRAEDGDLSLAARDLRALEQRILDALSQNASEAEIEKMLKELQTALDRYMQALMAQVDQQQRAGKEGQRLTRDDLTVEQRDLQRLIEDARELMRAGARDAARNLLSQLRNMLENLRAGVMDPMPAQQNEAGRLMRDLRDLAGRQQSVLDQTFRQLQESRQGQSGRQNGQSGSQADAQGSTPGGPVTPEMQEALRQALEDLVRRFGALVGKAPDQMGQADRAMRGAADALRSNTLPQAVEREGEALEALRQGGRAMARQLMERFTASGAEGAPDPRRPGRGRDPQGRATGNFGASTEDIDIPDQIELRRAREILDELRRRAGERSRPAIERDYIDRLLPKF